MTLREIFAPTFGPIAQLARASVWHTEGREFESRWVHRLQFLVVFVKLPIGKSGRVVEGAALEKPYPGNGIVSSNLTSSA